MNLKETAKQILKNENAHGFNSKPCPNTNCIGGEISLDGQGHLPCSICNSTGQITSYNLAEKLMLVVTEISEAVEADRNWKYTLPSVNLDMIGSIQENTGSLGFKEVFEKTVKNTFGDELADAVIRLLGISAHFDIDLEKHIELKMRYNSTRKFKHGKKY